MARKRRTARRKTTKTVRRSRRNPTTRRSIVRRASNTLAGLNVMGAVKESIPLTAGMLGAKFFAKRFGAGADQSDPASWNWRSYLQMAGGAFATGLVSNMIKRGSGQKALAGGMSLLIYELIQNEFVATNDTMAGWLGEDYEAEPFLLGSNGGQIPLDDSYRMQLEIPEYAQLPEGMMGTLAPVGPGLGDYTAEPTTLGSVRADLDRAYRAMYF